eukprot:1221250-Rhodomonas_salina.3
MSSSPRIRGKAASRGIFTLFCCPSASRDRWQERWRPPAGSANACHASFLVAHTRLPTDREKTLAA